MRCRSSTTQRRRKPARFRRLIHSSVERVEWALREVLPEYAPVPTPVAEPDERSQATHAG